MLTTKFAARRRGFTLIELLIVIVVIAILALIVIPKLMGASRRAKDATLRANLHVIRNGIAQYEADMGEYPADGSANLNLLWNKDLITDVNKQALWRGPYGTASSGAISDSVPLPKNPYVAESTDVAAHWTYTLVSNTPKIIPNSDNMGFTTDSESNAYSTY